MFKDSRQMYLFLLKSILFIYFIFELSEVVQLAISKYFTIDEFQYGHAAWLISKGFIPYRDFFEHHFPLLYLLYSSIFLIFDNNPNNIIYLRYAGIFFIILLSSALYFINHDTVKFWAILSPIIFFSGEFLCSRVSEIRPDALAFCFYALSLAMLYLKRAPLKLRALFSGFFLAFSLWASQKAFIYASPFALAFLIAILNKKKAEKLLITINPIFFLLGLVFGFSPLFIYLAVNKLWYNFFEWTVQWNFIHQEQYPGFHWTKYFKYFLRDYLWLAPFVVLGITESFKKYGKKIYLTADFILLFSLLSTLLSIIIQKAAFHYSFIPFIGIYSIIASRGIVICYTYVGSFFKSKQRVKLAFYFFVTIYILSSILYSQSFIKRKLTQTNSHQREIFTLINELTDTTDTIYDNSGSYVTRPHVDYFFFTDALIREIKVDYLNTNIKKNIIDKKTKAMLLDLRFRYLPHELKNFLFKHYQSYNGDIKLWGQRYRLDKNKLIKDTFLAIENSKYFIYPKDLVKEAKLFIDGKLIQNEVFSLAEGAFTVEYKGNFKDFYILWLPRNKKTYIPKSSSASFSKLF